MNVPEMPINFHSFITTTEFPGFINKISLIVLNFIFKISEKKLFNQEICQKKYFGDPRYIRAPFDN